MSSQLSNPAVQAVATPTPVVVSVPAGFAWLLSAAVLGVLTYYFIGIDQGMISVFGADAHVHEFVHDARHLLGFPCH